MTTRRLKLVGFLGLGLLALLGGAAALAWLFFFRGTEEDAVRRQAENYFSSVVEGRPETTYELLDSRTKSEISPDAWQQRNEEALQATGPLSEAKVTSVEIVGPTQAYASLELTFGDSEPLPVVVPLVKEDGKWKLSLSVNEDATDQWQHVEPTPRP